MLAQLLKDRVRLNSVLIVLCFVSVLLLTSQSAASFATYLLALAMLFRVRDWNDVFRVPLSWLVVTLLLYLVATVGWSDRPSIQEFGSFFSKALLIFLFVVAFAETQLRGELRRWLGRSMAIVGAGVAALAMIVWLVTNPSDGRLNGLGQLDTHVIAALIFSVALIFVLDALLHESARGWRLLFIVAVGVLIAAVYLSDSRNAWVSLLAGLGVFLFARYTTLAREFLLGVLALLLLMVVSLIALYLNESTTEFVLPRGDSFRLSIWSGLFERVLGSNYLFGLGIATNDNVIVDGIEFQHAHNMFLSVFFQGGLVGVALFVALIVSCIAVLLRQFDVPDAKLALGILTVALCSYLLDGHELVDKIGETWFLFWLPVAICLGLQWRSHVRPL